MNAAPPPYSENPKSMEANKPGAQQYPPPGNSGYGPSTGQAPAPVPVPAPGYAGGPTVVTTYPAPVSTTTVVMSGQHMLSCVPASVTCPNCHSRVMTCVTAQPGLCAYLSCVGLVAIGCGLGCCLIPFCMDDFMDFEHTCPNCNTLIGCYKRMN